MSIVMTDPFPEHRPGWVRVDRLLGEHGTQKDTAAGRERFEAQMEQRRREETEPEALKSLRRGWRVGSESFRRQMLLRMDGQLGEHHSADVHWRSAQTKAERIIVEELHRRGWEEKQLAARRKNDPEKLEVAARLRRETPLSIKAIAARVGLGTSESANATLHRHMSRSPPPDPAQGRLGI